MRQDSVSRSWIMVVVILLEAVAAAGGNASDLAYHFDAGVDGFVATSVSLL